MRMKRIPLLGCVLAGGRSTRMGVDKATLTFESGKSVLASLVYKHRSFFPRTIVSVRQGISKKGACLHGEDGTLTFEEVLGSEHPYVDIVTDATGEIGPMGGVVTALEHAEFLGLQGACVTSCDLPLLPRSFLWQLCGEWVLDMSAPLVTCFVTPDAKSHPLCAIWSVEALPFLEKAIEQGDYSLTRAIPETRWNRIALNARQAPALTNVNTPDHWEEVKRFAAQVNKWA